MKAEEKSSAKIAEEAIVADEGKKQIVICEVCGHGNPTFVGICEMCSNYLFDSRRNDNDNK